jgi:hypothetical protein
MLLALAKCLPHQRHSNASFCEAEEGALQELYTDPLLVQT